MATMAAHAIRRHEDFDALLSELRQLYGLKFPPEQLVFDCCAMIWYKHFSNTGLQWPFGNSPGLRTPHGNAANLPVAARSILDTYEVALFPRTFQQEYGHINSQTRPRDHNQGDASRRSRSSNQPQDQDPNSFQEFNHGTTQYYYDNQISKETQTGFTPRSSVPDSPQWQRGDSCPPPLPELPCSGFVPVAQKYHSQNPSAIQALSLYTGGPSSQERSHGASKSEADFTNMAISSASQQQQTKLQQSKQQYLIKSQIELQEHREDQRNIEKARRNVEGAGRNAEQQFQMLKIDNHRISQLQRESRIAGHELNEVDEADLEISPHGFYFGRKVRLERHPITDDVRYFLARYSGENAKIIEQRTGVRCSTGEIVPFGMTEVSLYGNSTQIANALSELQDLESDLLVSGMRVHYTPAYLARVKQLNAERARKAEKAREDVLLRHHPQPTTLIANQTAAANAITNR